MAAQETAAHAASQRRYYARHRDEINTKRSANKDWRRWLETRKLWKRTYRNKPRIHRQVYWAIQRGELVRPESCSHCHRTGCQIMGHHEDYSKPLSVIWLCQRCHLAVHRHEVIV